jgi:hypothetical protein
MPYLAHLSIRISRKFQIERDDWLGVDALATIAVEEAEANLVDPADIRRMAREQARQAIAEQIAEELAQRDARRAERVTARQRETAPIDETQAANGHRPPPATAAEAEQRFFARYAETIGGQDWKAVQSFLRRRTAKPTTVEGWIATAEAIRDRTRAQAS